MTPTIRHRRLYAFYNSKVLQGLEIIICAILLLMAYSQSLFFPTLCAALTFTLFVGYSLWIWLKKPERIILNHLLSGTASIFCLYTLAILAINPCSEWWYGVPVLAGIPAIFIAFTGYKDNVFDITGGI